MTENFYEYEDEESDGFNEWEDVDLNRKEDEEFNFEINNSPLNTKKSKQVALSKLTKKFKQVSYLELYEKSSRSLMIQMRR